VELEEVKRFSLAALQYALDCQDEPAACIVEAIALNGNARSLYAVCCTWAGSAEVALESVHGAGGGMWTFDADPAGAAEETFARRFVAAYANGDPPSAEALFQAALTTGRFDASLAALLHLAVAANEAAHQAEADRAICDGIAQATVRAEGGEA
jgi:hypothetical protein